MALRARAESKLEDQKCELKKISIAKRSMQVYEQNQIRLGKRGRTEKHKRKLSEITKKYERGNARLISVTMDEDMIATDKVLDNFVAIARDEAKNDPNASLLD